MSPKPREQDPDQVAATHRTGVWRHLRMLGTSAELADDLAQETFVVWLERRAHAPREAELGAWLRGVARNLLRNRMRSLRRSAHTELAFVDDELAERVWRRLAPDQDGATRLDALRACLAALPDGERVVLERCYRRDGSHGRAALPGDVSAEAHKSRLRRIKQRLAECVRRRMNDATR